MAILTEWQFKLVRPRCFSIWGSREWFANRASWLLVRWSESIVRSMNSLGRSVSRRSLLYAIRFLLTRWPCAGVLAHVAKTQSRSCPSMSFFGCSAKICAGCKFLVSRGELLQLFLIGTPFPFLTYPVHHPNPHRSDATSAPAKTSLSPISTRF